jgi:hypothetical protein
MYFSSGGYLVIREVELKPLAYILHCVFYLLMLYVPFMWHLCSYYQLLIAYFCIENYGSCCCCWNVAPTSNPSIFVDLHFVFFFQPGHFQGDSFDIVSAFQVRETIVPSVTVIECFSFFYFIVYSFKQSS